MAHSVFLSYARSTNKPYADILQQKAFTTQHRVRCEEQPATLTGNQRTIRDNLAPFLSSQQDDEAGKKD